MRSRAFLIFERIERVTPDRFNLSGSLDVIFSRVWPANPPVWLYFNLEVDERQEGVPINIRYESVPDGDGASGEAVVLANVDRIGPMRRDNHRLATFTDHVHPDFFFPTPGYYEIRAYVDDELVATFPVRLQERPNSGG